MAYVSVDRSRTWTAEEDLLSCPQIVQIASSDTAYVQMDFAKVLRTPEQGISSVATPTEVDSQTITIADESVSADGTKVSFKVSGMSAGDFNLAVVVTLAGGTTNVISRRGVLRVT